MKFRFGMSTQDRINKTNFETIVATKCYSKQMTNKKRTQEYIILDFRFDFRCIIECTLNRPFSSNLRSWL